MAAEKVSSLYIVPVYKAGKVSGWSCVVAFPEKRTA
jgi:hypothetical protein